MSSPVVWLAILSSTDRSGPAGSGVAASTTIAAAPSAASRSAISRPPSSASASATGSATGSVEAATSATGSGVGTATTGAGGAGGATSATGSGVAATGSGAAGDRLGRSGDRLGRSGHGSAHAATSGARPRPGISATGSATTGAGGAASTVASTGAGAGGSGSTTGAGSAAGVGRAVSAARRAAKSKPGSVSCIAPLVGCQPLPAVLTVDHLGGRDRLGQVGARRGQVGERRRHDLVAEVGRARQAARLGLVPAVRAGVLPALHAEVEGLVEGVQLVGGGFPLGLAPGGGHRLVHRGVVGQDEVLQPARHDLDALQPGLRTGGLERVASAATFAERFGQDLCHQSPRLARHTPGTSEPPERVESIAQGSKRPSTVGTPGARRMSG